MALFKTPSVGRTITATIIREERKKKRQEQQLYEDINWQIVKPVPDDDEPDQSRGS